MQAYSVVLNPSSSVLNCCGAPYIISTTDPNNSIHGDMCGCGSSTVERDSTYDDSSYSYRERLHKNCSDCKHFREPQTNARGAISRNSSNYYGDSAGGGGGGYYDPARDYYVGDRRDSDGCCDCFGGGCDGGSDYGDGGDHYGNGGDYDCCAGGCDGGGDYGSGGDGGGDGGGGGGGGDGGGDGGGGGD